MAMPASARVKAFLSRGGIAALDALLPPACLTCEAEVEAQGGLCAACFGMLSFVSAPFCVRCGVPLPHEGAGTLGEGGELCPACAVRLPAFAQARAALRYDEGAKRLVLPFKHLDRTELAGPLARHMARAGATLLARADLLTPVPLHWRRLLSRRYNQSALLAGKLGRSAGLPVVPDLLKRLRPTPPLGERSAADRALAVAGAFCGAAPPPGAAGRQAGAAGG
jgi:predicted amidophosphoribosyltransferase